MDDRSVVGIRLLRRQYKAQDKPKTNDLSVVIKPGEEAMQKTNRPTIKIINI